MSAASSQRVVGVWLLVVAAAVVVQVLLGGITRLTDSGLSITEWRPILGVVPPLDDAGWAEAFARYQQIPQFKLLKAGMTLGEFKFIYFWEWFHRLWGRSLGVLFLGPLLWFWWQQRLGGLRWKLVGMFLLGGAQGVMGWVMVASGLQDLVYVSHLRLAVHFMLAVVLFVWLLWLGLELLGTAPVRPAVNQQLAVRVSQWTGVLLVLLGLQLTWGAFMAGLKAALHAPTWPTINGVWLPATLFSGDRWWWDDPLSVHFVHRGMAYLLVLGVGAWWWFARDVLRAERHWVLAVVCAQTTLGVLTTVQSVVPGQLLWFGVAHQLGGLALLATLVVALRSARAAADSAARARPAPSVP